MKDLEFRQPITNQWDVPNGFHYWGMIDGKYIVPFDYNEDSEQYINRKDKNGTKLFENDIVKTVSKSTKHETLYKIIYDEETSSFRLFESPGYVYDFRPMMQELEKVGNTHENPEMIPN